MGLAQEGDLTKSVVWGQGSGQGRVNLLPDFCTSLQPLSKGFVEVSCSLYVARECNDEETFHEPQIRNLLPNDERAWNALFLQSLDSFIQELFTIIFIHASQRVLQPMHQDILPQVDDLISW